MKITVDPEVTPMSEELKALKQQKFEELVIKNQSDQIKLQLPDVELLGLTKHDLQDSQKVSQVMVIGQHQSRVKGSQTSLIEKTESNMKKQLSMTMGKKVKQMVGSRVTCYFIECLKSFDSLPDAIFSW